MDDTPITIRLELPHEALADETAAASETFRLGEAQALPPDPDTVEARFIDPVSILVVTTVAAIVWRVVNHYLVKDGRGVLIDARSQPPTISRLADVPEGFILLIKPDGSSEMRDARDQDSAAFSGYLSAVLKASV